jgi:integrase
MSVRKRKWLDREGRVHQRWMIHIRHKHPDGTVAEIRKVSPVNTKRGAERYERELRAQVLAAAAKRNESNTATAATSGEAHENTTLRQFIDTFLREHSKVEGLRPDYIREQQRVLERLVLPTIGDLRLAEVGSQHFSLLKRSMHRGGYSPKTINNALGVMSKFVRFWWERQELDAPRFKVGLIRLDERDAPVYEREVYENLVSGAAAVGVENLAIILMMGDAGLRQGEVRALQRSDLHFGQHPSIRVQRTRSREGDEHPPKGKRNRIVPMTSRLAAALLEHLRSDASQTLPHVFTSEGQPLTQSAVRARVHRAERLAGLPPSGRSHILRHTFVTSLADTNTPPRVIQELAGHKDLKTTLRYMHFRDGLAQAAIQALERLGL